MLKSILKYTHNVNFVAYYKEKKQYLEDNFANLVVAICDR